MKPPLASPLASWCDRDAWTLLNPFLLPAEQLCKTLSNGGVGLVGDWITYGLVIAATSFALANIPMAFRSRGAAAPFWACLACGNLVVGSAMVYVGLGISGVLMALSYAILLARMISGVLPLQWATALSSVSILVALVR